MKDIDSLKLTPPLNIVTVYLDSITRKWAIQFCERAKGYCGEGGIQWAHWKFDVLSDLQILEQAVSSAARANIISVAAYARTQLPPEVKSWLQTCLSQPRAEGRVLVALLGKASGQWAEPTPAKEYLAATAEATRVDYYLREFTLQTDLGDLSIDKIRERATATTGLLIGILNQTGPRCRVPEHESPSRNPTKSAPEPVFRVLAGTEDECEDD